MPELPEVEMIVRDLRSKIVGRRILGVQTDWPKYFKLPSSEAGFRACITGKVITAVDRRSKNVLISLTGRQCAVISEQGSAKKLSRGTDEQDANGILDDNLTSFSPLLTTS